MTSHGVTTAALYPPTCACGLVASTPEELAAHINENRSRPLAVWDNVTVCDRCGGDVHVTTDGTRVAATTQLTWERWHCDDTPERDGVKLSVTCGQQTPGGPEPVCGGTVTVDLSTEWWTTNRLLIDRLMAEGVDIP